MTGTEEAPDYRCGVESIETVCMYYVSCRKMQSSNRLLIQTSNLSEATKHLTDLSALYSQKMCSDQRIKIRIDRRNHLSLM